MKTDVFICYETTTGLSYAINLKEACGKTGMYAFVADDDIEKGRDGRVIIDQAIIDCQYFVVIMTLLAIRSSEEVVREIVFAHELGKHIIPCKPRTIDRFTTASLPVVSELQQVDFDVKEDLADKVVTIITTLEQQQEIGLTATALLAENEFTNVQTAVIALMVDNNLASLPNPVSTATNNMGAFPDASPAGSANKINDPNGNAYSAGDKDGYLLYGHDIIADNAQVNLVNYVNIKMTKGTYTIDASGTVTQVTTGYESFE